ncbi:MAG: rRNA maturation RNase YbeY [Bacteroidetes bacterium]|nr:rRNA maturation RNase YbeY [Bacteroidota bacterium]
MQNEKLELSNCSFFEHEVKSGLKQKRKLGKFINRLLLHYRQKANLVTYTFVSDEHLYQMNVQYLQHDTYTDIITFDLSDKKQNTLLCDIYISIDRVKENANGLGVSYQNELLRVILHGALHIAGFGDKTKAQKENMRALETEWIARYLTEL